MSHGRPRISWFELFALILVVFLMVVSEVSAAQTEDFDQYRVRISGFWLRSSPTVTLEAAGHNGFVDFHRDFGFNDYSTMLGKFDWKFARKHHFYVVAAPFNQSHETTLNRTIVFRGQTFNVGAVTRGELSATLYSPGYQYDIMRRKRGHLGIAVQFNLFDTSGMLSAKAQVIGPSSSQTAASSHASLLAPIPVAGPEFRLYLTNSPRLFVEGNVYGMYFFGYGNYYSTVDNIGFAVTKRVSLNAGYAIGSRLNVNTASSRNGLSLTQQGPVAGIQVSF
jgi:hypothetical protein